MALELQEIDINHLSHNERMRSRLGMLGKFPASDEDDLLSHSPTAISKMYEATPSTWDNMYAKNNCPWRGKGLHPLSKKFISQYTTKTKLLEIGFGNGDDAKDIIDLGIEYHGLDISDVATHNARTMLPHAFFTACDFFTWNADTQYDVIYDKGMFHNLAGVERREDYIQKVARYLNFNGIWIVVCGSADRNKENSKHGAIFLTDLVSCAEKSFEVLEIVKSNYGTCNNSIDFEAWYCAFRRR